MDANRVARAPVNDLRQRCLITLRGLCAMTRCCWRLRSVSRRPGSGQRRAVALDAGARMGSSCRPSVVFGHDKLYPTQAIRPGLDQVFKVLGIGTTASTSGDLPSIFDLGWRSYRLKGSQVDLTNAMGRKTVLGNAITEAGFMNNSSRITCHARAAQPSDACDVGGAPQSLWPSRMPPGNVRSQASRSCPTVMAFQGARAPFAHLCACGEVFGRALLATVF